jgi:hypothetical protein
MFANGETAGCAGAEADTGGLSAGVWLRVCGVGGGGLSAAELEHPITRKASATKPGSRRGFAKRRRPGCTGVC